MPETHTPRYQWREEHQEEIQWLENYTGRSSFLNSLRRQVVDGAGWLSEAQTEALQRNMREPIWEEVAAQSRNEREILNGEYTITFEGVTEQYQIYTVQRGALQGYRIIKRLDENGAYYGFAFLSRADVERPEAHAYIRVWRRFQEAYDRGEQYVNLAQVLVRALRSNRAGALRLNDVNGFEFTSPTGGLYQIECLPQCRYCNQTLQSYDLMGEGVHRAGCGPVSPRSSNRAIAQPRATRRSNITHDDISDPPLTRAEQDIQEEIERNRTQERINEDEPSLPMSELGTGEVR